MGVYPNPKVYKNFHNCSVIQNFRYKINYWLLETANDGKILSLEATVAAQEAGQTQDAKMHDGPRLEDVLGKDVAEKGKCIQFCMIYWYLLGEVYFW